MCTRPNLRVFGVFGIFCLLLFGCGSSNTAASINRVGLDALDVRDAKIAAPVSSPAGSKGGVASVTPTPAPAGTTPASSSLADSEPAYAANVQPLLQTWCSACHATIQSPFFAQADEAKAFAAVLAAQKIDLQDVTQSRLVLRLSEDGHNCPTALGCAAAAAQLTAALSKWLASADVAKAPVLPTTPALTATAAVTSQVAGDNPAGVLFYEAEALTLTAPMVATAMTTASGGAVVGTPTTATTDTNLRRAGTDPNLGTMTLSFMAPAAGAYTVAGYVSGVAGGDSFYLNMDNAGLMAWPFTPTAAGVYNWAPAAASATGAPYSFNLTAGAHTLQIRSRQAGAAIDKLVISSVPTFDPSLAEPAQVQQTLLSYDISSLTKIPGSLLTFEFAEDGTTAYEFSNPTIVLPSGGVTFKDLEIQVNGTSNPQYATFSVIDQEVKAPGAELLHAAMTVLKDKGDAADQITFTFGTLTVDP